MKLIVFVFLCCLLPMSFAADNPSAVYHNPAQVLQEIHTKKDIGRGVYDTFCGVCHEPEPVINVGAPRKGVKADWKSRIKQRNPSEMLKAIDVGMNNMPPRGGCFECTDEDLLAAINYLLPKK